MLEGTLDGVARGVAVDGGFGAGPVTHPARHSHVIVKFCRFTQHFEEVHERYQIVKMVLLQRRSQALTGRFRSGIETTQLHFMIGQDILNGFHCLRFDGVFQVSSACIHFDRKVQGNNKTSLRRRGEIS